VCVCVCVCVCVYCLSVRMFHNNFFELIGLDLDKRH